MAKAQDKPAGSDPDREIHLVRHKPTGHYFQGYACNPHASTMNIKLAEQHRKSETVERHMRMLCRGEFHFAVPADEVEVVTVRLVEVGTEDAIDVAKRSTKS